MSSKRKTVPSNKCDEETETDIEKEKSVEVPTKYTKKGKRLKRNLQVQILFHLTHYLNKQEQEKKHQ